MKRQVAENTAGSAQDDNAGRITRIGFQAEKRVSRGSNISAPIGEKPHIRSAATQQASSHPPTRRRFEKIRPNPSAPRP